MDNKQYNPNKVKVPKRVGGNAFLQFDFRGDYAYAYTTDGNKITKCINLNENTPYFVLPEVCKAPQEPDRWDIGESFKSQDELDYVRGQIVLGKGCFRKTASDDENAPSFPKHYTIILTQRASVCIDPLAFEPDSEVEFILPENFELKTIRTIGFKRFGGFNPPKNHILIADKNMKVCTFGNPNYTNEAFNPDLISAKLSVNKTWCIKDGGFAKIADLPANENEIENE